MKHVAYKYEPVVPGYWDIYNLDNDDEGVTYDELSILTIIGPNSDEMRDVVDAICKAIDAALILAISL